MLIFVSNNKKKQNAKMDLNIKPELHILDSDNFATMLKIKAVPGTKRRKPFYNVIFLSLSKMLKNIA